MSRLHRPDLHLTLNPPNIRIGENIPQEKKKVTQGSDSEVTVVWEAEPKHLERLCLEALCSLLSHWMELRGGGC